jgi:hypothetical protein
MQYELLEKRYNCSRNVFGFPCVELETETDVADIADNRVMVQVIATIFYRAHKKNSINLIGTG